MDDFKKKMNDTATAWDWNVPRCSKRPKGDTRRLHKLARRRLKQELRKEVNLDVEDKR